MMPRWLQGAINNVLAFKKQIEDGGLGCDRKAENICFLNTDDDKIDPALPSATRCWAGYQPAAGDASALSCTRADTCFNPVSGRQAVCDTCPPQEGEDFLSFACSSLTKKCTCGVQRYERTRCTSHSQCFSSQSDATCMRLDDVFSTAFSTTPCSSCMTQQVCVMTSADTAGYCACPFTDVEVCF